MKTEIVIDQNVIEPKVVIHTREITPEVSEMIRRCTETQPAYLIGYRDEKLEILPPEQILRIYADRQKVFAQCESGLFTLRLRLYEAEEKLPAARFVRVSNSEIVNFEKVKNLDLSITGTICLYFHSGDKTFVSRRYMNKIKTYLGLSGGR